LAQTWGGGGVATTGNGGEPMAFQGRLSSTYGQGGGGGGGGVNPAIANALTGATANYQQQFKARYDKMLGLAQQFGASQNTANQNMLRQQMAQGQAGLTTRGLGNSTVVNAVDQNAQDQAQQRSNQIAETGANMQLGVMNDVQPTAPNYAMYAQLLSQPGASSASLAGLNQNKKFNLFGG
jgi:hypothetical protein